MSRHWRAAPLCLAALALIALLGGCGGAHGPAIARDDGMIAVAAQSLMLTDASGRDTGRTLTSPALLVRPGEEFALPVSVSDMAGVAGVDLRLDFDSATFACVDVTPAGWMAASAQQARNAARGRLAVAGVSGAPSGPGVVATYHLRALASATPQNATVSLQAVLADARGETIGRAPRVTATVSPQSSTLIGDLNGTGTPVVGSAIKILRVVVALDLPPGAPSIWQWDCNKNGGIDVGDAIAILRCVVALDPWPIFQITEKQGSDGQTMVWVPPGEFDMGCSVCGANDGPMRHVKITKGFWIGKYPVTAASYLTFINAYGHGIPGINYASYTNLNDTYPYINASWNDAKVYCDTYNLRLPTEAEWEYAARGTTGRLYPWGNTWDPTKCCNGSYNGPEHAHYQHTFPVGSFPADTSWCGAMDVAGNASQWCQDFYAAYDTSSLIDPLGPATGDDRIIRGGCWSGSSADSRLTHRNASTPRADVMLDWVGFRCAQSGP